MARVAKDGKEMPSDPLSTFATMVDISTTLMMIACTAADGWLDFSFDIHQFHQNTDIPDDRHVCCMSEARLSAENLFVACLRHGCPRTAILVCRVEAAAPSLCARATDLSSRAIG